MLCNMSFKGFSSRQNPILKLFQSFKAGPVSAVGSPSSRLAFGNSQVQLPGRHILSQVAVTFERRTLSTSKTLRLSLSRITDHPT